MEDVAHCIVHHKKVEYVCPTCRNFPMCETCKRDHVNGTGHAPENCKEVGLAIMRQRIQDAGGRVAKEPAKAMREWLKELEAGILREIDRFQSSLAQGECCKMQELESEERYAELYFYAKGLPAGGSKKEAKMREIQECLTKVLDIASSELEKVRSKIAAKAMAPQSKTVFGAYKKDEVFAFKDDLCEDKGKVLSALKSANMSKFKAVYIDSSRSVGDLVASELASCLQAHPMSALYLCGDYVSDIGAGMLAQAAFHNKSLSAFCVLSQGISDTGAKAIAKAARNCRSLTTFCLFGWKIRDSGAMDVAEAVKGCQLSVFHLGSSDISDAGAISVANAVKNCSLSVFYLNIVLGNISDAGAIAVAKAVKDCSLSVFALRNDGISDEGATAVAAEILSGGCASTLSAFYLGSNNISDLGAKKVADAIKNCPLLSAFDLGSPSLLGETVAYILKNIAGTSTIIRSVNLAVREFSKEQMDSFLDLLQQSGTGKQLKLQFKCDDDNDMIVCKKFAAEWNGKLAEFRIVSSMNWILHDDTFLGVPQ